MSPLKDRMGIAKQAAFDYLNSELTLKSFADSVNINVGSIRCALNRMGHKIIKDKPNRLLMKQKGMYYFRLRKHGLNVFMKLSNDLVKARSMRDKLEEKYNL